MSEIGMRSADELFRRMEKRVRDRELLIENAPQFPAWPSPDVEKNIDLMQRADGSYTTKPPADTSSLSWGSMVESILRVKAVTRGMPRRIFVNPKYKQPLLEMCTVQEPQPMDKTTLMGLEIVFDPGVAEYRVEYVDDPPSACED